MSQWSPTSWQSHPLNQGVDYPDKKKLDDVLEKLSSMPPLITGGEVLKLKEQLKEAALGNRFLLQGGDCAESFSECTTSNIQNKFKILLQMSLLLIHRLRKPIVRVGRIAGQYAKPRSSSEETKGDVTLPSYRGDLINHPEFTIEKRTPSPKRMLEGYSHSAMTLNYLRALVNGGFADLHHPHKWDLSFFHHSPQAKEYFSIVKSIEDSLDFVKTIDGLKSSRLDSIDFFTSHEALHLPYESALTRKEDDKWYNLATHFPWVGMRTATEDSAHIEYLRGIENPIGVKIGPSTTPEWLQTLIDTLNPNNEPGKLTLITRFGEDKIDSMLPKLIKAAKQTNKIVLWSCDPMHGNTKSTKEGYKTRHFDSIVNEIQKALSIHADNDSFLGGVHLELTGEDVTECIGGARGLAEADLKRAYHSLVDPRLNYEQSLEIALQLTKRLERT
jgi:3-deoxy-7-phosphoheptulonate synthase